MERASRNSRLHPAPPRGQRRRRGNQNAGSRSNVDVSPGIQSVPNPAPSPVISDSCSRHCIVQELPDDVWFIICGYLSPVTLCKLCGVCKCFRRVASADCVWLPHIFKRSTWGFDRTCRSPDSLKELYRVALNWENGSRKEYWLLRYSHKMLPWIQRSDDTLLVSNGSVIQQFTIQDNGSLRERPQAALQGLQTDVTRFVVKNGIVASGCRGGGVSTWEASSGAQLLHYTDAHHSESQCVDLLDSAIVSGSKDKTVKVLSMFPEDREREKKCFNMDDRVWSLSASPCGKVVAVGTASYYDPAIVLLDVSSGQLLGHLGDTKRGAGVLDMKFESPNTLLTCGHDTYLRQWDLRSHTCVNKWEDKFDSTVYCLQTDGQYSMLTGTARHGLVRLWDRRQQQDLQAYYSGEQNSPVFCMAATPHRMYLAMDRGLDMVDFSVR